MTRIAACWSFQEESVFVTLIQFMWYRDDLKLWPAAGNGFDFSFVFIEQTDEHLLEVILKFSSNQRKWIALWEAK